MLVSPHRLNCQTINGRIVGTISDPSQATAPGAKVTAVNVRNNEARETTTSPTGDYVLSEAYNAMGEKEEAKGEMQIFNELKTK